jgi:hypothetical protein
MCPKSDAQTGLEKHVTRLVVVNIRHNVCSLGLLGLWTEFIFESNTLGNAPKPSNPKCPRRVATTLLANVAGAARASCL